MITILIILALLNPPPLRATWEGVGVARVSWQGAGCLFHNGRLYRCYDGGRTILIGARGPIDAVDRPNVGSVYTFQHAGGQIERAPLVGRVYFPVWR